MAMVERGHKSETRGEQCLGDSVVWSGDSSCTAEANPYRIRSRCLYYQRATTFTHLWNISLASGTYHSLWQCVYRSHR